MGKLLKEAVALFILAMLLTACGADTPKQPDANSTNPPAQQDENTSNDTNPPAPQDENTSNDTNPPAPQDTNTSDNNTSDDTPEGNQTSPTCPDGENAPSVALKGPAEQYFVVNDPYFNDHELGAEAWDDDEGNLTNKIQVDYNMTLKKVGDYAIHYQVEDCTGQKTEATRMIHVVKNYSVFLHSTHLSRSEPWISDGTPEGTHMIEDTNTSMRYGFFSRPIKIGDKAFFRSDANGYYHSLWVSDGTVNGTHLVKKTNPHGVDSVEIKGWSNELLFFNAADGKELDGRRANTLWVTDGTENGTHLYDGKFVPNGKSFELANGKSCYLVDYWKPKIALWCGDGSIDGTEKVLESDKDTSFTVYRFNQNHIRGEDKDLILWNGTLYETNGTAQSTKAYTNLPDTIKQIAQWDDETFFFTAYVDNKAKLYRSASFSSDPVEIKNKDNNSVSVELYTGLGDRLYFRAYNSDPWRCSYSGLWRLDNPKTDTQLHKISDGKICKVGPEINGSVFALTRSNNLWVYRVNDNNFTQLDDLRDDSLVSYSYDPSNICRGKFIVRFDHGLWATDGTQEGTEQFYSGPVRSMKVFEDQIFTRRYERREKRFFYYKSQGTAASTVRIDEEGYYTKKLIVTDDKEIIYSRYDLPLYVHDKTTDETYELMKDINKATEGVVYFSGDKHTVDQFGAIAYFGKNMMFDGEKIVRLKGIREMRKITYLNGKLYFLDMGDRIVTTQLYRMNVDGTEMEKLSGVWEWAGRILPEELVKFKGYIYFPKQGKATLSRINNDMTQPENIQDKNDRNVTYVRYFKAGDNLLYFQAAQQGGGHGTEPFRTDGTPQGTFEVKDIKEGWHSSLNDGRRIILGGIVKDDKLYFRANDGNGTRAWVSDGTEEGTFPLIDENPLPNSSSYLQFAKTEKRVYFRGIYSSLTWGTDGTKAGTFKVANGKNDTKKWGTFIGGMGSRFYFAHTDDAHGEEVWTITDDSQTPTLLRDIADGNTSGISWKTTNYYRQGSRFVFGGRLYFYAMDRESGARLWATQGAEDNTVSALDHAPEGPYTTLWYNKEAQLDAHHLIVTAYSPAAVYLLDDNGTTTLLDKEPDYQ